MNINLRDVVCTSKDGEKFTKLTECYIRGSSIKYLRLPEEAVDRVLEEEKQWQGSGGRGRGGKCVFYSGLSKCSKGFFLRCPRFTPAPPSNLIYERV